MKCIFSRLLLAVLLGCACLVSPAFADVSPYSVAVLSWTAPTLNDDGSPLTDLMGYYVYAGRSPEMMIPYHFSLPGAEHLALAYPTGTYYFAIAAVNVDGVQSLISPVVSSTP